MSRLARRLLAVPRSVTLRVARAARRGLPSILPDIPLPAGLQAPFEAYAAEHLRIDLPPLRIEASDGGLVGYLEEVVLRPGHLLVRGWALGDQVTLLAGQEVTCVEPAIERRDVVDAFGGTPDRGFEATLPVVASLAAPLRRSTSGPDTHAARGDETVTVPLPQGHPFDPAHAGLKLRFHVDRPSAALPDRIAPAPAAHPSEGWDRPAAGGDDHRQGAAPLPPAAPAPPATAHPETRDRRPTGPAPEAETGGTVTVRVPIPDAARIDAATAALKLRFLAHRMVRARGTQRALSVSRHAARRGAQMAAGVVPAGADLPLPARLEALFTYYATQHLRIDLPATRVRTAQGATIGYLEEVVIRQGRLHVSGWTLGDQVTLSAGKVVTRVQPTIERNDVAVALDCAPNRGFRATLPVTEGVAEVAFDGVAEMEPGARATVRLSLPDARRVRAARAGLKLRFLAQAALLGPGIVLGALRRDPLLRERVKAALDLASPEAVGTLDPRWLRASDPAAAPVSALAMPPHGAPAVIVVMPVHNAFDVLPEALDRLLRHTRPDLHLVLVEDLSSDRQVRPWLRDWAKAQAARPGCTITLLENDTNLGFIGSVNRAFEAIGRPGAPVVLMNSDAFVPEGWAERLLAPLAASPDVASATPMSNDAEIFSTPAICAPTALAPGQGDAIDRVARSLATDLPPVEVPTGVGFCMALAPGWFAALPRLDPTFGPGYGEEVDWCRKIAARGGRHVAVPGLFVEHRGGASFGSTEKRRLVARNNAEIARRYPDYDAGVRGFITADPLLTPRAALALAYLDSLPGLDEVPVYLAHDLGGGAECALQQLLDTGTPTGAVVIRVGGVHRFRLEVVTEAGTLRAAVDDDATLAALISRLSRRRIVYSCGVGAQDADRLPDLLLRLAGGRPIEVLFHDFFPISPSYNLLDSDLTYRGAPRADTTGDRAHRHRRRDGRIVTLDAWQEGWGRLLAAADRIVVFSKSSREIVAEVFPQVGDRIAVEPHDLPCRVPPVPVPQSGPVTIGVLGNIGPQKGARLLQMLSGVLRERQQVRLVLLGRIDPNYPLARESVVHGPYERRDIPHLVERYGITCWLVPSIWPETFSYSTHECAATGLPMIAFDLGAQGDVVRSLPGAVLLPPPGGDTDLARSRDRIVEAAIELTQAARRPVPDRRAIREV